MKLPKTWVLTVERQIARFDVTAQHLTERGIEWERFNGFDNEKCELSPIRTFDMDRAGERIGKKHIAATLSHMAIWYVMLYQPDDSFIVYEYDVELVPDFQEQFDRAMSVMPEDWDVIMLGSACRTGRETKHIAENVYEIKYPLAGHAMMYRKKALPTLIREHQAIYQPLDIALYTQAFPLLRVYTIVEPIAVQRGTPLPA